MVILRNVDAGQSGALAEEYDPVSRFLPCRAGNLWFDLIETWRGSSI
jgi:hypothetical protein